MDSFWKGKKITAYIALKHHTRFIVPIMETLTAQGATVNFLVAQAERSQEITAIETGLDYHHIFDFLKDSDQKAVNDMYIDLRDTFGPTLINDIAFSLQVQTVLDKTISTTAQEYIAFKNYFEQCKPDICLALHEVNRWGKMFAFHAKRHGIPFITLQEGLLTTASANLNFQMTGHVQYSTFCFVWGESSRQKLIGFEAPEERVIPVGNTHLSDEIKTLTEKDMRTEKRKEYQCEDKFVVLLLFSSDLPPFDEILPIFEAFQNNKELMLFTKFHPATTRLKIDTWLGNVSAKFKKNIHPVHGEEYIYNLIAASDLCVLSEGSTTGLEALAIGKPLVLLKLVAPVIYKSNLVEENAAIDMTPSQLADGLTAKTDFKALMDRKSTAQYLKNELFKSEDSIDFAIDLIKTVIKANQADTPAALSSSQELSMDWSIILPVPEVPENFLAILEEIAIQSGEEKFEVILIKPEKICENTEKILNSLEGDISILTQNDKTNIAETVNLAASDAKGRQLVILQKNIAPKTGWLMALKEAVNQYDTCRIFGAKVTNKFNNIIHSGIVLNPNNQPVSAYMHLDGQFPASCKSRPFQMLDHFICTEKNFFLSSGGFDIRSGRYMFLDFCLRTIQKTSSIESVMHLHNVELISLAENPKSSEHEDSLFFYSRWHKELWESEVKLLESDGVSMLQLDAARMTRAIEIASLQ